MTGTPVSLPVDRLSATPSGDPILPAVPVAALAVPPVAAFDVREFDHVPDQALGLRQVALARGEGAAVSRRYSSSAWIISVSSRS